MQPAIISQKKGELPSIKKDFKYFRMILQGAPEQELAPRYHKYDMPKFGEPGMLMAEIPSLSCMLEGKEPEDSREPKDRPKGPPIKPLPCDMRFLELSGEMITRPYGAEVAEAQGKMLRNFLGILAQKVTDVRHEKFAMMKEYEEKLAARE